MKPDSTRYIPDVAYVRQLIDISGLSQGKISDLAGIPRRTFQDILSPLTKKPHTYPLQYVIECIASDINPDDYFKLQREVHDKT